MGNIESSTSSVPNYCIYYQRPIPAQQDYNYCPFCGSKLNNALHQEVDYKDLEFSKKDLIGEGTYAKVYRGRVRGVNVAVKVPNLDKLMSSSEKKSKSEGAVAGSEGEQQFDLESSSSMGSDSDPIVSNTDLTHAYSDRFQNFLSEVQHLREVNHPNVCLLMGTCFVQEAGQRKLLLVYELMDEDLNAYMLRSRKAGNIPSLIQRLFICCQVASGLSWVSSKGIIHGDLKPTNILRKDNLYKVTDFGLATFEDRTEDFEGGAPIWSAPEILEHSNHITLAVDVFSFGYLLWHVLRWKDEDQLFRHVNNTQQLIETVCQRHELPEMGDLPERLQELIGWCLSYKSEDRPTYDQLIFSLNEAMLDVAIPAKTDAIAGDFWRHYFSSKTGVLQEKVAVDVFMEKFSRFLGLSPRDTSKRHCVQEFFEQPDGYVTLEHYGRMIALFGPFSDLEETKSPPGGRRSPLTRVSKPPTSRVNAHHVVAMMEQLRDEPWFCGVVPSKRVAAALKDERPGAFLVRYSNNTKAWGHFCLSRVTKSGNVRHHYITKKIAKDGTTRSYSLQLSKTEEVTSPTLSDLMHKPRVLGVFYLLHPVRKLAQFRRTPTDQANDKNFGYALFGGIGFKGADPDWDLATMASSPPSVKAGSFQESPIWNVHK